MADLGLNPADLRELGTHLSTIAREFRDANTRIHRIPGAVGHSGLQDAVKDFTHEWDDTCGAMIDDIDTLAKAAAEVGAHNMEKLTVRQAIRLKPSELADSEPLFAKPVADLQPGQRVYRLHNGEAFPEGAMKTAVSGRVDDYLGLVWGRVDSAGAGLDPGFSFVRVRVPAVLKTGWWASIDLCATDGSLEASRCERGETP